MYNCIKYKDASFTKTESMSVLNILKYLQRLNLNVNSSYFQYPIHIQSKLFKKLSMHATNIQYFDKYSCIFTEMYDHFFFFLTP